MKAYIFKRPSATLQGVGGKERPHLNMFPHIDFLRFFFWGTRLYIDTSHAKRNSVAIFFQVKP